MVDRFRGIFSPQSAERPREWEDSVANTLRVLNFQMHLAETAKTREDFQESEHAQRVRGRIGNLKDLVLDSAAKTGQRPNYPDPIAIDSDKRYFYIPKANKLVFAEHQVVANGVGGFASVADLTSAQDIDEKTWCLDKALVGSIAKKLIDLLPQDSSRRILSTTS